MSAWGAPFWKATTERAVKTFLQTYFAIALAGDVVFNVFEFNWLGPELGISLGALILSVISSLISNMASPAGPSLANEAVVPQRLNDVR